MDTNNIPLLKKTYVLYKKLHTQRQHVAKQDRYTIYQRCENDVLDILENIIRASQLRGKKKLPVLKETSVQIDMLRVFLRLLKDVKAITQKAYIALEEEVDEIGRMTGGWIKSLK